jgi:hypothetical protein
VYPPGPNVTIGTAALFVCGVGADSPSPDFTAVP